MAHDAHQQAAGAALHRRPRIDDHGYLSEQRRWRPGLSFEQVLLWKQCAPSALVSQRFASLDEALRAFQSDAVQWFQDLYLRRMGDQLAAHRCVDDYKPTAMRQAGARGPGVRSAPSRRRSDRPAGGAPPPPAAALRLRPPAR
ncbi:hypothetical protein [Synechococcus sp. CCY 9618]|uniref:hypothetical protein n=1 Tax=Synechococcus sp. CCY 9618 TaxID=2815602 RepID=UPI001C22FD3A|nr:hypothetical protein [Synechococcus sp. CCY 9618]